MKLTQHPLSAAFPSMPASELAALVDDVKTNGQREPGTTLDGQVLDGWHRYIACSKVGIEFKASALPAGKDPVAFVKSRNLHRRHLTDSQRASSVVACAKWAEGGARAAPGAGVQTNAQMAAEADVGERTIRQAKVAERGGLGPAVRDGKISAKRAAEIVQREPSTAKKIAAGKIAPEKAAKATKPSKILPRPQPKEAKPEPLDVAREHAKKQNAAIKELRASVAERDARIEALTKELRESRDNAAELAESLDACIKAGEGDTAAAKEIKRLLGQIRVLEATRDQYMTKCNELVKTVKSLQRKAEKKP